MKTAGKPNMQIVDSTPDASPDGIIGTGRALQRVQSGYTTAIAVQRPRTIEKLQKDVLKEAELAADSFFYSWTTKNKDGSRGLVEGISIEGALILVRNWGNCATDVWLDEDGPMHWVIGAAFIDHETGYTGKRLFRQRKAQNLGKYDVDRAQDIVFQIGQSKAIRNVVLNSMPGYLKDRAIEKAKEAAESSIKDLPKFIADWVSWFGKGKVSEPMLIWKIGCPINEWTKREAVMLRALAKAIIDRQTTIRDEFGDFPQAGDDRAATTTIDATPAASVAQPSQATPPDQGPPSDDSRGDFE
jgi:hypothetical protein